MPTWLILALLLTLALTIWAQAATRSAFARYSKVPVRSGLSGAEAARFVLREGGVEGVTVEVGRGFLTDHYDPRKKVLRLSPEVFEGRNVAAMGVAAHEAGHAIQDAAHYAPLGLRNLAVPTASLGSSLGFPLIFLGLITHASGLRWIGLLLFAGVVLLQLITLPVEIDASRRAVKVLAGSGMVQSEEEEKGVKAVLTAAAMTYVAAALSGIVGLLYFVFMARR